MNERPKIRLLIRSTLRAESEPTPEQVEQVMALFRKEWERQDAEHPSSLQTKPIGHDRP